MNNTEYGKLLTIPAKIQRDQKQVDARRQIRAKQQAQADAQAQMSNIIEGGKGASEAAKNLGSTPVGGGMNALQAILGQ